MRLPDSLAHIEDMIWHEIAKSYQGMRSGEAEAAGTSCSTLRERHDALHEAAAAMRDVRETFPVEERS